MKRKLTIFISISFLMATLVSLCGCNSGDSSEKPANDISKPHDISFDYNDDDFHDKSGNDILQSDDTKLEGEYYLSMYEEQEPIDLNIPNLPLAMKFTDSEVKIYYTYYKFEEFYPPISYSIDDGIFKTLSDYRQINSEFKKGDGCFYLKYESGDKVYNLKYSKQNIFNGKYKHVSDLSESTEHPGSSATQFEFKGNEVTITYYDGREATYEYAIYGQKMILKPEKNTILNNFFQIYGYTGEHFFTYTGHVQFGDLYCEYTRVD